MIDIGTCCPVRCEVLPLDFGDPAVFVVRVEFFKCCVSRADFVAAGFPNELVVCYREYLLQRLPLSDRPCRLGDREVDLQFTCNAIVVDGRDPESNYPKAFCHW